jgi:hypothetical protein
MHEEIKEQESTVSLCDDYFIVSLNSRWLAAAMRPAHAGLEVRVRVKMQYKHSESIICVMLNFFIKSKQINNDRSAAART